MTAKTPRKKVDGTRPSFVEVAYDEIKRMIFSNEMPPGFRSLEADLAKRFDMSRTPLREALLRLQSEGFVQIEPRRGMVVLPISPDDMDEIYQVITALETAAAELAAPRRLPAAALKPLEAAIRAMDGALAKNNLEGWADADEAFHRGLLDICGNRRLAAVALTFRDQIRRTRNLTLRLRPLPRRSNDAHRKLLDAIRSGDPARAFDVHRGQRLRASGELTDILRRFNLSAL
jgi:DNA-binding GntR family transcriptional regulator